MSPLLDLALLLFGAKLGGILFTKIKQPSVVGELVAGIILGPSLLAIVNPSILVTSVADLGLLFLILLVSLSIDWKNIETDTEKFAWIELTRAFFVFVLVFAVSSILSWSIYTFLVVAFITVMSSTALASRTLADIKELESHEGKTLMGVEVVDTIFAIICVAILANMLGGEMIRPESVLTILFLVVGVFVVMNRVGFRLVNRLTASIQKYGVEEALLGFTLLVAFLLGSLTESLKLESILGIFIAGMILSKSAQLPIIVRKVKDIGESFFIPIFFASVGLTVNILSASEYLPLMAGLTVAILVIKMASSVIALRLFNFTMQQSLKIGSGLVSLSEITIVIVALASSKVEPAMFVSLVVSYLIINAVSPVLMNSMFRSDGKHGIELQNPLRYRDRKNTWKKYHKKIGQGNRNLYDFRKSNVPK